MAEATTNWVPAVSAGIGALAALGGQLVAGWFQRRNQERTEAIQRRERAAEALAEARAFLVDASPDRIGINASPERSPEVLRELGDRRERIRIPLLTLAGSHPSPHVRRLAQQLELEMANMLVMDAWLVRELLRGADSRTYQDQASEHHTEALRLARPAPGRDPRAGGGPAGQRRTVLAPERSCQPAKAADDLTALAAIVTVSQEAYHEGGAWRTARRSRPMTPTPRPNNSAASSRSR
jgi:hypothetical protein